MFQLRILVLEKPFGFVVIDKPSGLTSHDCVNRLRKVFGIKKIGHGGTLDPSVTGVLPIAIGDATRLISYLKGSKAYTGIIQLGASTMTDDIEGEFDVYFPGRAQWWVQELNAEKIPEIRDGLIQKRKIYYDRLN